MHIVAIEEASAAVAAGVRAKHNHHTASLHVCNTSELMSVPISKNSSRREIGINVGCFNV